LHSKLQLVLALTTSLKSSEEITRVLSLPLSLHVDNYGVAFSEMGRNFLNSLLITAPAVVLSILIGSIAGYPLAMTRARGGKITYFVLLSAMLVPFQIMQIPLFFMIHSIGLCDTIPGMWLVHTAYTIDRYNIAALGAEPHLDGIVENPGTPKHAVALCHDQKILTVDLDFRSGPIFDDIGGDPLRLQEGAVALDGLAGFGTEPQRAVLEHPNRISGDHA
jgi:hypothetical protein